MTHTSKEKAGLKHAVVSSCGKYRYVLRRSLDSAVRWHKPCLFIMLNPSTADAQIDDPTIRRCMAFAKREGRTHLTVVNLFALRSTDPKELFKSEDPHGPDNRLYLQKELDAHKNGLIIAAWGAHKSAHFSWFPAYYPEMLCLGTTKDGYPRHPLYVKSDAELKVFRPESIEIGKDYSNDLP